MNKYERLSEKLKNREKVIGTTMAMFRNPFIVERMNRDELDFILFDGEHGIYSRFAPWRSCLRRKCTPSQEKA